MLHPSRCGLTQELSFTEAEWRSKNGDRRTEMKGKSRTAFQHVLYSSEASFHVLTAAGRYQELLTSYRSFDDFLLRLRSTSFPDICPTKVAHETALMEVLKNDA
jgi:hypothetical protein